MIIKQVKWLALFVLAIFLSGCLSDENQQIQVKLQGRTMGVAYHITYIDSAKRSDEHAKSNKAEIDRLLDVVNQQMSTYRANSELSRFNQSTELSPFAVSEDTAAVVQESIRLAQLTDGKLDVTIGPLVNLWGFGPQMRPEKLPTADEVQQAKARVGIDKLEVIGNSLVKHIPTLYVDLSTTAKGFGVDKIARYLDSQNIVNYLVEIGGEVRARGKPNPSREWVIAIEKPISDHRAIQQFIEPKDNGLATSGDYRQYFEQDGQRFSHIIDPDTAMPINHKLVSVTVIHPSCMTADGLSTSIMLMGPVDGEKFAVEQNLAAFMIIKTDNGFREVYTDAFKPFLVKAQ